jgi:hypothetical protein
VLKIGSGISRIGLPLTIPSGPSASGGDTGTFGLRGVVPSEKEGALPKRSPQEFRPSDETTGIAGDVLLFKRTSLRTGMLSICGSDVGCAGLSGVRSSDFLGLTGRAGLPCGADRGCVSAEFNRTP